MYTDYNFKSKKQLKDAVTARQTLLHAMQYLEQDSANEEAEFIVRNALRSIPRLGFYQPGPFAGNEPENGTIYLEGPHYPEPHRWYAQATVKDGSIVSVK